MTRACREVRQGRALRNVAILAAAMAVSEQAYGATSDPGERAFQVAVASELRLGRSDTAAEVERVAKQLVSVADRYPAHRRAPEALSHAARVLAGGSRSDPETLRRAVDLWRRVAADYPDDSAASESLQAAASLQAERLHDPRAARATLTDLVTRFPTSRAAPAALDELMALRAIDRSGEPEFPSTRQSPPPVAAAVPWVTGVRTWSGPGGLHVVLDVAGGVKVSSTWDPTDTGHGGERTLRVTLTGARVGDDLRIPSTSDEGLLRRLAVRESEGGAVRVDLVLAGAGAHEAFALGDHVVISVTPAEHARGGARIVLDPGHGGKDPGARSPDGLLEKDVTLAIARALAARLRERLGLEVVLTRDGDEYVPLEERTAIANSQGADVFVSIHANASRQGESSGLETYFLSPAREASAAEAAARENGLFGGQQSRGPEGLPPVLTILNDVATQFHASESSRFAHVVHEQLVTGVAGRYPVRDLGVKQAPFVVLMGSQMPGLLAELGFITHPDEGRRLADPAFQSLIADRIELGIGSFLHLPERAARVRP